jgi:hypothetical protein
VYLTGFTEWQVSYGDKRAQALLQGPRQRFYLERPALVMYRYSCGETWLLQPKIRSMELLEYKVTTLLVYRAA